MTAPIALLLVEDDEGDAVLVQDLLEDVAPSAAPFAVRWVRTLADAEAAIVAGVDCVLLDLGLPDATGLGALERVRAADPDAAVLVLTGLADMRRGVEALAGGAQDYLVKGQVDGELLARSIRYAIERRRAEVSQRDLRAAELHARENARLERGLLPRPLLRTPDLAVASGYRPGRRRSLLGGDFYDVVEDARGVVHAVVGDVCGHGPDEAALGVALRIAWRTLMLAGAVDDELLGTLQQVLEAERHDDDVFATLCMVSLPPGRAVAQVRRAGHPAPILLGGDGATSLTAVPTRPPLGVAEGGAWVATPCVLPEPPWTLVLYTDGLIEGRVGEHGRLGVARLEALLADRAADLRIGGLIAEVEELGGGPLADDVAVLALARR